MKILCISFAGMGNTLLFTPTLRKLKQNIRDIKIDFLVRDNPMAEILKNNKDVNEIFLTGNGKIGALKTILKLRNKKYDYTITVFPSNKWFYNLIPFLIGAKNRVTHSYKVGKLLTLSFLQNKKIEAIEGISDLRNNLNILKSFNIKFSENYKRVILDISKSEQNFANKFLRKYSIKNSHNIIGVHPGCGGFYQFGKRFPISTFIKYIKKYKNPNTKILIFGGAEENELKKELNEKLDNKSIIVNTKNVMETAALIRRCNLFISNDSGLMHIAAAFSIKQIAFFGPTNPTRTAPLNKNAKMIQDKGFKILKYPFRSVRSNA